MAYSVDFDITSHPLSREENGVTFTVDGPGGKLGELLVSKGGVRWKPKNKQQFHFLRWADFDKVMRDAKIG